MHIAIDIRSLMEGRHSGVEEYTTQIIRGMLRVSPSNTYHLFYNAVREVSLPEFHGSVRVHAFRYPNKGFNLMQWAFSRPQWDKMLDPHPDVVFVPNPRLAPISSDVPLVTVAHDLSFEKFPEFLDVKRRVWHHMMQPRVLMKNSDHIIAVSEHTKHDVMQMYGVESSDISVIHSGIREDYVKPPAVRVQQVRRKYGLPKRFVLYFGTLEPRKNISSIINAFSGISEYVEHDVVIAGESGWLRKELDDVHASSGCKDRIHFIDFVEEEDKSAVFAAADLFVYPSFYEGFGFPPLESLLAGTPVVTSFNSALPEVVGQWATLIDPYNVGQLADVMQELLHNSKRVPRNVQGDIRDLYSWDMAARKTIQVLEGVV